MPLYEYKCERCGEVFELIQKFSDTPLAVHDKCGGPVHRLISTSALQFKGSGWYVNDYGKGGKSEKSADNGDRKKTDASAGASSASDSSSPAEGASGSSSETKKPSSGPSTETKPSSSDTK